MGVTLTVDFSPPSCVFFCFLFFAFFASRGLGQAVCWATTLLVSAPFYVAFVRWPSGEQRGHVKTWAGRVGGPGAASRGA